MPPSRPPGRRVQLHRALSKLGWGSRTRAWDWIRAGEVRVDGRVVTDPLAWVDLGRQQITRAGTPDARVAPLALALHKPRPRHHPARQVRRMTAAVGHKLRRLVRVAVGRLELGDLPAGACRVLDGKGWDLLRAR